MVKTRNESSVFLVGTMEPDSLVRQTKLPTIREVMKRLLILLSGLNSIICAVNQTATELMQVWKKTTIKHQLKQNMERTVRKLYFELKKAQKEKKNNSKRKQVWNSKIDDLLDISQRKIEISDPEAAQFLEDQRTKRLFSLSALNKPVIVVEPEHLEEDKNEESADAESDYEPPSKKKPKHQTTDSEETNLQIITNDVVEALDRAKISDRQAFKVMMPVLKAVGQDASSVAISRSTISRKRKQARQEIAKKIKEEFVSRDPMIVHFDGKMLDKPNGSGKEERLPTLVSFDGNEKLLGAPALKKGTGEEASKTVYGLLRKWNCEKHIQGLCFDTTSVNTGRSNGACANLEKMLGRELIWLACRHHVLELLLSKAFCICFGPTTSPETNLFKVFREKWSLFKKKSPKPLRIKKQLETFRDSTLKTLQAVREWPRNDYRELFDLTLFVLGSKPETFSWKAPGAVHHARWMSKLIYATKIFLLRGEGKLIDLSKEDEKKLERFVQFGTLLYTQAWAEAPLATEAALNDLMLWTKLKSYRKTDSELSDAVCTVLSRHLWYLSEDLVGMALFSAKLSDLEKEDIVRAIKENPESEERSVTGCKSTLNTINPTLADFATQRSLKFFGKMKIEASFLEYPAATWPQNEQYREGEKRVKLLKIVNDLAERGVKLCEEYCKILTKNDEEREFILQVVEKNRKAIGTDCTKKQLQQTLKS
ncbi:uncharacterized protein LOC120414217 isoform X2 [Culex pipiens pallens]|uniref:uncharacterized protein LOC120414217 isoform X2 n=1 Tax=Culex pipiens pallens TaxID=42434 RepID=UPI001953CE9D|nr:uncharacterized protein LOC120414217 isoform X2 [Culex pipiens pallens]